MSKIFEALERAEAERTAAQDAVPASVERPTRRTVWHGVLAGALLGFGVTALVSAYLVAGPRSIGDAIFQSTSRTGDDVVAVVDPPAPVPPAALAAAASGDAAPMPAPAAAPPAPQIEEAEPDVPPPSLEEAAEPIAASPPLDAPRVAAADGGGDPSPALWVQLGAFRERANADALAAALARDGESPAIRGGAGAGDLWAVRVGPYPDADAAAAARRALAAAHRPGFVVRD